MNAYWHYKAQEQYDRVAKHAEEYHEGIQDVPNYIVLFFYGFMSLIVPAKRKDAVKDCEMWIEWERLWQGWAEDE